MFRKVIKVRAKRAAERAGVKPARLDADGTAQGLTRVVAHHRAGDCVWPGRNARGYSYDADDGTRTRIK